MLVVEPFSSSRLLLQVLAVPVSAGCSAVSMVRGKGRFPPTVPPVYLWLVCRQPVTNSPASLFMASLSSASHKLSRQSVYG